MEKINGFEGEYRFLSNFWPCKIEWQGQEFQCSEALYMAFKSGDPADFARFAPLDAREAKKLGKTVVLRADWDQAKISIMRNVLALKFRQNADLREKLLATGEAELIEKNWWRDEFWGVCNGVGENWLGRMLSELREKLREEEYGLNDKI